MKIQLQNSKGHPVGTCEHEGIKLDIGCGMGRRRDCIGIDISPTEQTDIVRDFETQGLPFCDRSVERIYAYNMLEHIGEGFHFLMMEMWRVLKDDGVLELIVPNGGHEVDFGDPTHKRHFNKRTFAYFTKSKPKYHSYLDDHKWIIDKLEIKKDEEGRDELIYAEMRPDRSRDDV